jgi:FkbM family methyltransferase
VSILSNLTRVRGHTIWTPLLGPQSVVIDAGAHRGEFSSALTKLFDCRCILIEANPRLASQLAFHGPSEVVNAALAVTDGMARFFFRENMEAGGIVARDADEVCETAEIGTISLSGLMRRYNLGQIELLKLDIEGAEFELLARAPGNLLKAVAQITVEFHDFLTEFRGRGFFEAARKRLTALGFACFPMAFRTHGDVLFLNRAFLPLSAIERLQISIGGPWAMRIRQPGAR